ncbi:cytochrome b5-like heme/steroid binding domain containing protein [Nitzschia inconspicua]|uniref:Cytochrome b5-like heme/steroid binding domain containing protein n=1 Tax=Nitzschia inconspicua TaxID=303405 RepID=A0A9K3L957_9STRA|nr:cytochrome b5-like heme/steroid binding domain containing protein [Nitzschia inconspicua]
MAIQIDRQEEETEMRRSKRQRSEQKGPMQDVYNDDTATSSMNRTLRYYSRREIALHNTEGSAWIVAGDDVYDVTEYMHQHPAGKAPILKRTGGAVDCTQDLMFHSKRGQSMWREKCLIGRVTNNERLNGRPVEKPWWAFWDLQC